MGEDNFRYMAKPQAVFVLAFEIIFRRTMRREKKFESRGPSQTLPLSAKRTIAIRACVVVKGLLGTVLALREKSSQESRCQKEHGLTVLPKGQTQLGLVWW